MESIKEENFQVINYRERYHKVLDYVESNLDSDLDIESLSNLVYLSKHHFQRQFTAFFGISIYSLIKNLRLKRAAYQLVYRVEHRLIDIAMMNGYESPEAFSRAFSKTFGQSPLSFRKNPDWSLWYEKYDPIIKLRRKKLNGKAEYDVSIVDFPETSIAAFEHKGAPQTLGNSIRKFIAWRKENGLPPNKSEIFNLAYNDPNTTEPDEYRFGICCSFEGTVGENSYGVVNKTIPKGKCAALRHIGNDDTIDLYVDYLYSSWLVESEVELREYPVFLKRVSLFPEVSEKEMINDIYLPIK